MTRSLTRYRWCLALAALCAAPALAGAPALGDELLEDAQVETAEASYDDELPFGEYSVAPVAYDTLQPAEGMESMGMGGMTAAAPASRPPTTRRAGPTGSRQANIRLASIPNMFGDIGMSAGQIVTRSPDSNGLFGQSVFDVPSAGGSRRVKIGENNVAMPSNRVYVMYNHFHNVFQIDEAPTVGTPRLQYQAHVDRYTVGFEKMFLDDLWSIEVRQALNSSFDYTGTNIGINGGSVGNTAVILKNLLYQDESTAVGGGVAFDLPTGSNVEVALSGMPLEFQNDAFHILPWIGFASSADLVYVTGFAQLDFAANGNEIRAPQLNNQVIGIYNEQNLLYLDLAIGSYVYRNPSAERLTSVALQGELHYTSTLQDTDLVSSPNLNTPFAMSNRFNRQDILNGTVALQFQLGLLSTFRVAAVAPLSEAIDERVFDAELQVQFNRRF